MYSALLVTHTGERFLCVKWVDALHVEETRDEFIISSATMSVPVRISKSKAAGIEIREEPHIKYFGDSDLKPPAKRKWGVAVIQLDGSSELMFFDNKPRRAVLEGTNLIMYTDDEKIFTVGTSTLRSIVEGWFDETPNTKRNDETNKKSQRKTE